MDWPYTPVQDPLRGAPRGRRGTRRTVRKPVVAEQLGLYRDEKLERLKCGCFLIAFSAGRRDARLNRGVVIRRLRRVRRAFQPGLRMSRQTALGPVGHQPRKRLRRTDGLAMCNFVRT